MAATQACLRERVVEGGGASQGSLSACNLRRSRNGWKKAPSRIEQVLADTDRLVRTLESGEDTPKTWWRQRCFELTAKFVKDRPEQLYWHGRL